MKTTFRVLSLAGACLSTLSAASFSANLTVTVSFQALPGFSVSSENNAANLMCMGIATGNGSVVCPQPTTNFNATTQVLTYATGAISGTANLPNGSSSARSTGQSAVIDLFNTTTAPLLETVTLNWAYALTALAVAPENATAFAAFSLDDVFGAAPVSLFAFNQMIAAPPNSAAPPPNPMPMNFQVMVPVSAIVGGVLMASDKIRIDPTVGGTADVPEPGTITFMLIGLIIVTFARMMSRIGQSS